MKGSSVPKGGSLLVVRSNCWPKSSTASSSVLQLSLSSKCRHRRSVQRFPEDKHIEMDGEVEDEGKQKAEGKAQERPRERHSNRIPVVEAAFVGGRTK